MSEPQGATVTVDGEQEGDTPITVQLSRKRVHAIRIEKAGYLPYDFATARETEALPIWAQAPFVFIFPPALISLAVDTFSGAAYKNIPDEISVKLTADQSLSATTSIAVNPPTASSSPSTEPAATTSPAL